MDNILKSEHKTITDFETPVLPVANDRSRPLYSLPAIALATFLGTGVAGAFLLTRNLQRLDRAQDVGRAWLTGIALFFGCIGLSLLLPRSVPAVLYGIIQVGGLTFYAMVTMGSLLKDHDDQGGQFVSLWKVAGISAAFCLALMSCMTGLLMWKLI